MPKSFTDFAEISRKEKKIQEELRNEVGSNEYAISTFGENTEEWQEAKLDLEEKKEELSNQIELSFGFVEFREILNNSAEGKSRRQIKN